MVLVLVLIEVMVVEGIIGGLTMIEWAGLMMEMLWLLLLVERIVSINRLLVVIWRVVLV